MNLVTSKDPYKREINKLWVGIAVFVTLSALFPEIMGWVVATPIIVYGIITIVIIVAALIYHGWKSDL